MLREVTVNIYGMSYVGSRWRPSEPRVQVDEQRTLGRKDFELLPPDVEFAFIERSCFDTPLWMKCGEW